MTTRHVLLLSDSLPGALTSTAAMLEALQKELQRRGHAVQLTGMGSEEIVKTYQWAIYTRWLKSSRLVVRAGAECLASVWLGLRLLAGFWTGRLARPELLVLFTPSLFLCLTAWMVRKASGCKIYMVQRDIVPDWLVASGRAEPGPAVSLLYALKNFSLRHADRVGIECEENRHFFPEQFHPRIEVLHNWRDFNVDVHEEPPASERISFVYGGRVGQVQGFDRFVRPFAALAHPNATLTLYCDERGQGEIDALDLPSEARARIEIQHMRREREFLELAAKAWFGVVTLSPDMKTHNIPGKMLAYLAAGIPVVALGPRDAALGGVVRRLGIGAYVDADDEAAIRDTLRQLIESPQLRTTGRRAVIAARREFSPASAADQILALLP